MSTKRIVLILCIVAIISASSAVLLTYGAAYASVRSEGEIYIKSDEYDKLMRFFELNSVEKRINESYYKDVDAETLIDGAFYGMVESMGDGYSRFYPEEDFKEFDEKSEGSYIGQGMMLEEDTSGFKRVVRVFPGTSADEANVLVGDLILAVDGRDTRKIDMDNTVSRLRGADGTTLTLKLLNSEGKKVDIELVRTSPEMQVVFTDMLDNEVGYVDIVEFSGSSVEDFKDALKFLESEGAKAAVIDLRGAPGGYISQAVEIADMLLPECKIAESRRKLNNERTEWKSDKNVLWTKPLCILTDEKTMGVAELFAAAMKENNRATLVGERTKGKGVTLSFFQIEQSGAGMKLVTGEYFSPMNNPICDGVTPNVEVKPSSDKKDNQLNSAIEVLEGDLTKSG